MIGELVKSGFIASETKSNCRELGDKKRLLRDEVLNYLHRRMAKMFMPLLRGDASTTEGMRRIGKHV